MPVPAAVLGDAGEVEENPAGAIAGKPELIRFHWSKWVKI
jgi:hypothetical protein